LPDLPALERRSLGCLRTSTFDGVPVSRFPYHVAYLVTTDQVHVVAIAHDRRRPIYWSARAEQ
jgi:hypothetical protein